MTVLEIPTPARAVGLVDRQMRRVLEELGVSVPPAPAADVYEGERELVVELEVPGFGEEELEVTVSDHTLAIRGERVEEAEKGKALRLHERLERKFERRFALPSAIDSEHVTAEYRHGVLTVHVPKTVGGRSHTVSIETVGAGGRGDGFVPPPPRRAPRTVLRLCSSRLSPDSLPERAADSHRQTQVLRPVGSRRFRRGRERRWST
jgi:HSP20 family protein